MRLWAVIIGSIMALCGLGYAVWQSLNIPCSSIAYPSPYFFLTVVPLLVGFFGAWLALHYMDDKKPQKGMFS
jgi:hypothetical protein